MRLLWALAISAPWLLPALMSAWNAFFFAYNALLMGHLKLNVLRYAFAYWGTIKAARDGDMTPFLAVFAT
jgi:hypothetical protein